MTDISELGMCYVHDKLKDLGFKPTRDKKRKSANIYIDCNGKKIKNIKVRVSRSKNENNRYNDIKYWGWTVQKKDESIEYDFLVCVALKEDFENLPKTSENTSKFSKDGVKEVYIFTKAEMLKVENHDIRFKSVQKTIVIFENKNDYIKASKIPNPKYKITDYEEYINENKSEFIDKCDMNKIIESLNYSDYNSSDIR